MVDYWGIYVNGPSTNDISVHYKGEEGTQGENGSGFSILVDLTKPSFEDLTLKMAILAFFIRGPRNIETHFCPMWRGGGGEVKFVRSKFLMKQMVSERVAND